MHKKSNKKINWLVYIPLAILLTIVAGVGMLAWVYKSPYNSNKIYFYDSLNLPVAIINNNFVHYNSLKYRIEKSKTLGRKITLDEALVLELDDKKKEIFLKSVKTDHLLNLKTFIGQSINKPISKSGNFDPEVSGYINQIVLQTYFNEQKKIHSTEYKKAESILGQLKNGDSIKTDFVSDSGFIEVSKLLPEIQLSLKEIPGTEPRIIATRFGILIFEPSKISLDSNSNEKKISLRSVFIPTSGYNDWIKKQITNIKVKTYLKN